MTMPEAPSFVNETEALLRLAVLAAIQDGGMIGFPGFCDDLREALAEAFERGRRFETGLTWPRSST